MADDQQSNLLRDNTGMWVTLKRWREAFWRMRRADLPDLEPGEAILLDGAGSLVQWPPLQGRLTLTNQRLMFHTDRVTYVLMPPLFRAALDVWMVDVAVVTSQSSFRNVWKGFPGVLRFSVTSIGNVTYTFQVSASYPWVETINEYAPLLQK